MPQLEVRRVLGWSPAQLYDIAADVERYPEFLPWWISARVMRGQAGAYTTEQVVGIGPVRQSFLSRTVLEPPERIDVTAIEGPFQRFHLIWRFAPSGSEACEVSLAVDLEMRSALLGRIVGRAAVRGIETLVTAFEARARALHGPPTA